LRLKFKLITFSVADFPLVVGSDVNKDLGPKAKDTGHKVKAKAKALRYQGQGQGLWSQGQGLGSQGQGQGLEMSKPITKTEGQS